MKRTLSITSLILIMLSVVHVCAAQGIVIHQKDGTKINVPYEKLDSIVNFGLDEQNPDAGGARVYKKDGTVLTINYADMDSMKVTDKQVKEPLPVLYVVVGNIEIKMIPVEGGRFRYGLIHSADADIDAMESTTPIINLSDFYISETEVTSDLWYYIYYGSAPTNDGYPISAVGWQDAVDFIDRLKQVTGKPFRMPTNAEWEFAARGGNLSVGYKYAGSNNWDDVAAKKPNSYSVSRVKTKQPNELGIYDMSGNLGEHVYDDNRYGSGELYDPVAPWNGDNRYVRGSDPQGNFTDFDVTRTYPSCTHCNGGIRLLMDVKK